MKLNAICINKRKQRRFTHTEMRLFHKQLTFTCCTFKLECYEKGLSAMLPWCSRTGSWRQLPLAQSAPLWQWNRAWWAPGRRAGRPSTPDEVLNRSPVLRDRKPPSPRWWWCRGLWLSCLFFQTTWENSGGLAWVFFDTYVRLRQREMRTIYWIKVRP